MATYYKQKVKVYKKTGDATWDSTGFVVTDAFGISVTEGIGKIKDTFSFSVVNSKNKLFAMRFNGDGATVAFTLPYAPIPSDNYTDSTKFIVEVDGEAQVYTTDWTCDGTTLTFTSAPAVGYNNVVIRFNVINLDDNVKIWQWTDSANESASDLTMDGVVSDVPLTFGDDNILQVKGRSFVESIFDTAVPIAINTPSSPAVLIQNILNNLSNWNRNREVTWHPDNPTTKADSSAFPTNVFIKNYTNVNEMLEELSSEKYTEDGTYIYWIERSGIINYFVWGPKTSTVASSLTQGTDIADYKTSYNTDDMINAIIFMCGFDINGNPVSDLTMDITSITRYGAKFYFLTKYEDTATQLITQEMAYDTGKAYFNYDNDGKPISPFYPKSYSPAYTIKAWRDRSDGSVLTATSDTDFNAKYRIECQAIVRKSADKIIQKFGLPRLQVDMTLPFTATYTRGSLQNMTLDSYNVKSKPLRLFQITYGEGEVTFSFKEDEETVVV